MTFDSNFSVIFTPLKVSIPDISLTPLSHHEMFMEKLLQIVTVFIGIDAYIINNLNISKYI